MFGASLTLSLPIIIVFSVVTCDFGRFFRRKNDIYTHSTQCVHSPLIGQCPQNHKYKLIEHWRNEDEERKRKNDPNNLQNIYINRNYKWSRSLSLNAAAAAYSKSMKYMRIRNNLCLRIPQSAHNHTHTHPAEQRTFVLEYRRCLTVSFARSLSAAARARVNLYTLNYAFCESRHTIDLSSSSLF